MRTLRKIVFLKYNEDVLIVNDPSGQELSHPDPPPVHYEFGRAVDLSSPNVSTNWSVEALTSQQDHLYYLVAWRHTVTILEPGDEGYSPEQIKAVGLLPRQRLAVRLQLTTDDDTVIENLTGWLGTRLQDCPFGLLTLEGIDTRPPPTKYDHLAKDDD